ncbi:interferon phi 1 [Austrofundulus limnaeus]|uniref:Interferon phi 1 n=1 Tax=Austrofundulus limnaeus TaxID=52670 RepID=A0A2I4CF42_AUSLI|nr:PREDICTED: interferon a3-like [Austrofundulus limnaeus]
MVRSTSSIFILCSVLSSALGCDWFTRYSDLRNSSRVLIEVMGGEFTHEECHEPFPSKRYSSMRESEVQSQLIFIRDSMKQIFDLFRYSNVSSASWDPVKFQDFLETINRQIQELNNCISNPDQQARRGVKKYFRNLKVVTLSRTGESRTSWEILRKETKLHLDQLEILGNQAKDKMLTGGAK